MTVRLRSVLIQALRIVASLVFREGLFGAEDKLHVFESVALDQVDVEPLFRYPPPRCDEKSESVITLELRHVFHRNLVDLQHGRMDAVHTDDENIREAPQRARYHVLSTKQKLARMSVKSPEIPASDTSAWGHFDVLVPNVTDRDTIVTLATMSSNAYVEKPLTGDWLNVTNPWETSIGQGWMSDGVRTHVFVNAVNNTVVLAIKGTSAAIFHDGGNTVPNDKTNDNLFFSCCCARISYLWSTVCDCYTSGKRHTCNQRCLQAELLRQDRYYRAILDMYRNVTAIYPEADVWVTGHSLGGSLASFLGRTYGLPVVTFEAVPELLPIQRLHLPLPPLEAGPALQDHVWHFGHTADPIYMGSCTGAGSACWVGGYAMETRCHSGKRCVYDVVADMGWHVSLMNHRIHTVIDDVLTAYNNTAHCEAAPPCEDCSSWNYV